MHENEVKKKENKENPEIKEENKKNNNLDKEELLIDKLEEKPKEKKRYFGIDLIRVFACYLVMQTHAGEIYYIGDGGILLTDYKNIWPGIFNSLARICVPLFAVISGYLLLPMKTDYLTFLRKRFTRISFPFIIFCILYDIFFYILGFYDTKTMFINIPKIFINLHLYIYDYGNISFYSDNISLDKKCQKRAFLLLFWNMVNIFV